MQFDLTAQQRAVVAETFAQVSASSLGEPLVDAAERRNWKVAGELGLLGLPVARDVGGAGLGALDTALRLEALGRACPDTGFVFALSAHTLACAVPVDVFGSSQARERYLPGMCSGDLVAANAMTEDEAGSDSSALETTAAPVPGGFRLHGSKSFASNAPVADVVVTYAVTDPKAGHLGVSGFVLGTDLPGLRRSEPFDKLGLTSCAAGRVEFEGVDVATSDLLGAAGQGAMVFQHSMLWERCCLFAGYLGSMQRQLDSTVEHVRSRRQFGGPLARNQAVAHRVATMAHRLESARLLLYRAAALIDTGSTAAMSATAHSKLATSQAAVANSIDALQLLGGRGFLHGSGPEADLRNGVPATLFSGTSEIQLNLICAHLGMEVMA